MVNGRRDLFPPNSVASSTSRVPWRRPSSSQRSQEMDTFFGFRPSVYTNLALGAAIGAASVCAIPFALGFVGFTAGGVAAGSIAAGMGGPAVAAGSLYAGAQSIAAAGFLPSTATAMVTGGAVLNAAAGGVRDYCGVGRRNRCRPRQKHRRVAHGRFPVLMQYKREDKRRWEAFPCTSRAADHCRASAGQAQQSKRSAQAQSAKRGVE